MILVAKRIRLDSPCNRSHIQQIQAAPKDHMVDHIYRRELVLHLTDKRHRQRIRVLSMDLRIFFFFLNWQH